MLSPRQARDLGVSIIFQEFQRLHTDGDGTSGLGLGLSIVRRLAGMYGGDAVVRSEKGVGTTFTVTIDREPAAG